MEVVLWSPSVGFGDMKCFLIVALLTTVPCEIRADAAQPSLSAAIQWDSAALQGVRDAKLGAPVVAPALAIVHACMHDAWSAYDDRAVGTQLGGALRRPAPERMLANKEQAISYAAPPFWNIAITTSPIS